MTQSANLFEVLRTRARDPSRIAIETPNGTNDQLWRALRRVRPHGPRSAGTRRRARRPGCGADRQVARGDRAGARLLSRRRGVAAAEHRLHARRARVFSCRRGAGADALPPLDLVADLRAIAERHALAAVESFGADGEGGFLDRLAAAREELPVVFRAKDDLAAILYTSGTTGRSKGAMLTHENLASNAAVLVDFLALHADDVLIHALPIFHTHGLFVATNVALFAGATMLFQPRFDAEAVIVGDAARDRADGRADVLYPAPRPSRPYASRRKPHAALHLRLGAAARRDASRAGAKRPATRSSSATA